jgi:hypothetical protein
MGKEVTSEVVRRYIGTADGYNSSLYVRSNINQPWGQATNEDAMDAVFDSGKWTTMFYEALSLRDLLCHLLD